MTSRPGLGLPSDVRNRDRACGPRLHAALLFGLSQAEPVGDTSAPGVAALPLPLLLQQPGRDVILGRATLLAQFFLRKQVWEREGLSVGLEERGPAPAGPAWGHHAFATGNGTEPSCPTCPGPAPTRAPSRVPACRGNTLGSWAPASVWQWAWQRDGYRQ